MNALNIARNNARAKVEELTFERHSHAQIAFQYFGYIECGHSPHSAIQQVSACTNPMTVAKVMRVINGK